MLAIMLVVFMLMAVLPVAASPLPPGGAMIEIAPYHLCLYVGETYRLMVVENGHIVSAEMWHVQPMPDTPSGVDVVSVGSDGTVQALLPGSVSVSVTYNGSMWPASTMIEVMPLPAKVVVQGPPAEVVPASGVLSLSFVVQHPVTGEAVPGASVMVDGMPGITDSLGMYTRQIEAYAPRVVDIRVEPTTEYAASNSVFWVIAEDEFLLEVSATDASGSSLRDFQVLFDVPAAYGGANAGVHPANSDQGSYARFPVKAFGSSVDAVDVKVAVASQGYGQNPGYYLRGQIASVRPGEVATLHLDGATSIPVEISAEIAGSAFKMGTVSIRDVQILEFHDWPVHHSHARPGPFMLFMDTPVVYMSAGEYVAGIVSLPAQPGEMIAAVWSDLAGTQVSVGAGEAWHLQFVPEQLATVDISLMVEASRWEGSVALEKHMLGQWIPIKDKMDAGWQQVLVSSGTYNLRKSGLDRPGMPYSWHVAFAYPSEPVWTFSAGGTHSETLDCSYSHMPLSPESGDVHPGSVLHYDMAVLTGAGARVIQVATGMGGQGYVMPQAVLLDHERTAVTQPTPAFWMGGYMHVPEHLAPGSYTLAVTADSGPWASLLVAEAPVEISGDSGAARTVEMRLPETVGLGHDFLFELFLHAALGLNRARIEIPFDAALLEAVDVKPGPLLNVSGLTVTQMVVDNVAGVIYADFELPAGVSAPATHGALLDVVFRARVDTSRELPAMQTFNFSGDLPTIGLELWNSAGEQIPANVSPDSASVVVDPAWIGGQVLYDRPMPGYTASVELSDGQIVLNTETDSRGYWTMPGPPLGASGEPVPLPDGEYVLSVNQVGYLAKSRLLNITGGIMPVESDIKLLYGDLNPCALGVVGIGDNSIDLMDLAFMAQRYNLRTVDVGYHELLDVVRDGVIDIFDLVVLARNIQW